MCIFLSFVSQKKKKTNLVNEKNVRIKMYVGDGHGISICYPFTISLFFFEMSNETTIAIYEIAIVSKIISAIYQRTRNCIRKVTYNVYDTMTFYSLFLLV